LAIKTSSLSLDPMTRKLVKEFPLLALALALVGMASPCAAQLVRPQPHPPGVPVPEIREQAQVPVNAAPGSLPTFEFRSGFWTNLHHFLYEQALLRTDPNTVVSGSEAAKAREVFVPVTAPLSTDDLRAWNAALDYYIANIATRDLMDSGDLIAVDDVLAELEGCQELTGTSDPKCASGLRPQMIAVLSAAAPVYRAHWWKEDDRANRAWITAVSPLVEKWGVRVANELSNAYESSWPRGRIPVDMVGYAGPLGAYTTLQPLHLLISSRDPRNQGNAGVTPFEILFNEASHGVAVPVLSAIIRKCREQGKLIPRNLWNALVFYTTGTIVEEEALHDRSADAPVHPSDQALREQDSLDMRGWANYLQLLHTYWQPYLNGGVSFDVTVDRMVAAL
jgi:hypothetical protein